MFESQGFISEINEATGRPRLRCQKEPTLRAGKGENVVERDGGCLVPLRPVRPWGTSGESFSLSDTHHLSMESCPFFCGEGAGCFTSVSSRRAGCPGFSGHSLASCEIEKGWKTLSCKG